MPTSQEMEAKVTDFYEAAAHAKRHDATTVAQLAEHREKRRAREELWRDGLATLWVISVCGIAILIVLWAGDRL